VRLKGFKMSAKATTAETTAGHARKPLKATSKLKVALLIRGTRCVEIHLSLSLSSTSSTSTTGSTTLVLVILIVLLVLHEYY
jgi:hypothetical protein